jgi:hypothetical protein
MPSVAPNITVGSTPTISVDSISGVSYNQINQSIGSFNYLVKNIYIYSSNISQLLQPIGLKKYNKFGDKHIMVLQPMIDPYQDLSALNQTTRGLDYAFDSNNGFYPTISANTTATFQIDTTQLSDDELLGGRSNFDEIEFLTDYLNDF